MSTITEICFENSFKVARRDYKISYETYMKHRPTLVASKKCSYEFLDRVEDALNEQAYKEHVKQYRLKLQTTK